MKTLVMLIGLLTSIYARQGELVLFDLSGSMTYLKQDSIVKVINQLFDEQVKILGFNQEVTEITSLNNLKFGGNTDLGNALEYVYTHKIKDLFYIDIVTDGEEISDANKTLKYGLLLKSEGIRICSSSIGVKTIPDVLKKISTKAFKTTNISLVLDQCESVRKQAIHEFKSKQINTKKFNLF